MTQFHKTQRELIEAIEPLLDNTDLAEVLFAIGKICYEKAEHLRVTWQDENGAKQFDRAGQALDRFAVSEKVRAVS